MTWRDQSGNGNDLAARAGAEPTYEPVAVYLDPVDHDAIERQLDEQMGLSPKPAKWRSVGPSLTCEHVNISRAPVGNGMTAVSCSCSHSWMECE